MKLHETWRRKWQRSLWSPGVHSLRSCWPVTKWKGVSNTGQEEWVAVVCHLVPVVTRLSLSMMGCPHCRGVCVCVWLRMFKQKTKTYRLTDASTPFDLTWRHFIYIYIYSQILMRLLHSSPPDSSITFRAARKEAGKKVLASANFQRRLEGSKDEWLTAPQVHSLQTALTRQGIYIPLHTCQETVQLWIITADQVLWRGEHAGSDGYSGEKEGCSIKHYSAPLPLSLMKTNSSLYRLCYCVEP